MDWIGFNIPKQNKIVTTDTLSFLRKECISKHDYEHHGNNAILSYRVERIYPDIDMFPVFSRA